MAATPPSLEQLFYLEHFRGRTIVVADASVRGDLASQQAVDDCVQLLAQHGIRVVLVREGGGGPGWRGTDSDLVAVWQAVRGGGSVGIVVGPSARVLEVGVQVASRLRAHKLVLLDPERAPAPVDRRVSFATIGAGRGATEGPSSLSELALLALEGGVENVNVCRPMDLATELLTYQGAGTLFTMQDYCTVERLGIDDFDQVERLIERGVQEGYLKPRSSQDLARLLVNGYGARFGDHHLAGFAAMLTEPYEDQALGEVCALTTISRFAGGGVATQIVSVMLAEAAARGLRGIFACTTSTQAAGFFLGLGFDEVSQGALPATKWEGYDPQRRQAVRAFLRRL